MEAENVDDSDNNQHNNNEELVLELKQHIARLREEGDDKDRRLADMKREIIRIEMKAQREKEEEVSRVRRRTMSSIGKDSIILDIHKDLDSAKLALEEQTNKYQKEKSRRIRCMNERDELEKEVSQLRNQINLMGLKTNETSPNGVGGLSSEKSRTNLLSEIELDGKYKKEIRELRADIDRIRKESMEEREALREDIQRMAEREQERKERKYKEEIEEMTKKLETLKTENELLIQKAEGFHKIARKVEYEIEPLLKDMPSTKTKNENGMTKHTPDTLIKVLDAIQYKLISSQPTSTTKKPLVKKSDTVSVATAPNLQKAAKVTTIIPDLPIEPVVVVNKDSRIFQSSTLSSRSKSSPKMSITSANFFSAPHTHSKPSSLNSKENVHNTQETINQIALSIRKKVAESMKGTDTEIDPESPVNNLYSTVKSISQNLDTLANFACEGDKPALRKTTKELLELANVFAKQAQNLAVLCSDVVFRARIHTEAVIPRNIAIQLTILAAMFKEGDAVMKCAQELCDAVVTIINVVKSASTKIVQK